VRSVDAESEVLDVLVQSKRNKHAATARARASRRVEKCKHADESDNDVAERDFRRAGRA
jgi:transposase-like protein